MAPKSLDIKPKSYRFFESQFTKPVFPPKGTSLANGTAIITGGNVGIGFATAETVLGLGLSRLILAVRTPSKGEAAASKLLDKFPKAKVDVWQVDMLSYQSVQAFARKCETLDRIDFALLNAGVIEQNYKKGPEGHENMFQVNYLSTVLLATLLLPTLKQRAPAGKPGRLTIVNSGTSIMAKFPNAKLDKVLSYYDDESVFGSLSYPNSKGLAHFWILKLAERVKPEDVIVNLVDPGLVKGTLLHRNTGSILSAIIAPVKSLAGRTMEQGASTYVDAAVVRGKESHGCYLQDWKIFHYCAAVYGDEGRELAERVWNETLEELSFVDVNGILSSVSK
ncbi:hypothetical protein NM208_g14939 [Fusarium decemcellulare]|uniref:Uncharacterized protein n=1 Tax=Fusarium decemcellulare TaxID=57161 RepID=A0ACC1RHW2_9HYPO|nr:hypothetical protein NM208_g14939 [Fusarium decemcellulare]